MRSLFLFLILLASLPLSSQARELLGLQPVVIVSNDADGRIVDVQVRVIEAKTAGEPVDPSRGLWIIRNGLDARPEFERVLPTESQLDEGRVELSLRDHDRKHGVSKRTLLFARRAASGERVSGYVAYAPSSGLGYVKATEPSDTWIAEGPGSKYVVTGFMPTSGPRQYEVLAGEGLRRTVVLVPEGRSLGEIVGRAGLGLRPWSEKSRGSRGPSDVVYVGSVTGFSASEFDEMVRVSGELRARFACARAFGLR